VLKVDYASPIRLAHGVDPATAGHLWLLRRGFRVFRNQLFMRLDLAGWEMPESVRRVVGDLAASGVDFRVAVDDDLPGLLRVAGQFGEHLAGTFRDNAARGDSYPVLIAAHGDEVLGLVGRLIVSGCGYPDFDLIAVSGPHRGRGIGKALFHICLENFQRRGGRIFELMTSPTNPAQKLYLDAGMRVVTTLVCLEKRLSEGATDPAAPASP
jgi:GNAT superfamily N-acetyltransferase